MGARWFKVRAARGAGVVSPTPATTPRCSIPLRLQHLSDPPSRRPHFCSSFPSLIRPKYPGRIQLLDGHNQLKCEAPLTYFTRIPILVKASDPNDGLHMILTPKPQRPWLLSESGKFSFHSLIELVASTHQEGWTVGAGQLSLENLVVVSEVGIFKFKHPVARYALNDDNRAEDFHALAKVMASLLASLHGDSVVSCLPIDFSMLLDDLSGVTDPELQHISIENHPSLLPSSS
ncbi:hypothetical protein PAHAL_9G616300 [Panicum hallii]|uniref:Uncharacterized protein n=1 Tax=Panicum hallii TaxID=206008 RepID=A0A2S3IUI4_9POAL|nr:uncharacterized protein LOC112877222 isoform X1 [Panicum hallii]PAN51733.1 hypothetical protein PAHAL_9G616300 [Panicum hallii]